MAHGVAHNPAADTTVTESRPLCPGGSGRCTTVRDSRLELDDRPLGATTGSHNPGPLPSVAPGRDVGSHVILPGGTHELTFRRTLTARRAGGLCAPEVQPELPDLEEWAERHGQEASALAIDRGRLGRTLGPRLRTPPRWLPLGRSHQRQQREDPCCESECRCARVVRHRAVGRRYSTRRQSVRAVALDNAGNLLVLREHPAALLVRDLSSETHARVRLDVPDDHEPFRGWSSPSSRWEGIVPLRKWSAPGSQGKASAMLHRVRARGCGPRSV
jgi:hypothetical protein